MKAILIDADNKAPNLALMKISAMLKAQGFNVFLKRGTDPSFPLDCLNPDKVYLSCVFEKNRDKALDLIHRIKKVTFGGHALSVAELPKNIEHIRPDYCLYGLDFSLGFTSRGCIRSCPWCVVPKAEGKIRNHAPLSEFLDPSHDKLVLLDNNFLASPKWRENLQEMIDRKLKVSFNQGLDIRLINDENASMLAQARCYDRKFKNRRLYFAFDTPEIAPLVLEGIRTLEAHGIRRSHLMFYVLVGFNTTYKQDMERISMLVNEGIMPYVMPYNDSHDGYLPHLERWVNGRFYKLFPFEQYDQGNAQQAIAEALA